MAIFGWFQRKRDTSPHTPDVDERLRILERDSKSIRLEWDDTYEQLHKVARKLARREQREAENGEGSPQPDIAPTGAPDMSKEQLRAVARARGLIR